MDTLYCTLVILLNKCDTCVCNLSKYMKNVCSKNQGFDYDASGKLVLAEPFSAISFCTCQLSTDWFDTKTSVWQRPCSRPLPAVSDTLHVLDQPFLDT